MNLHAKFGHPRKAGQFDAPFLRRGYGLRPLPPLRSGSLGGSPGTYVPGPLARAFAQHSPGSTFAFPAGCRASGMHLSRDTRQNQKKTRSVQKCGSRERAPWRVRGKALPGVWGRCPQTTAEQREALPGRLALPQSMKCPALRGYPRASKLRPGPTGGTPAWTLLCTLRGFSFVLSRLQG